MSANEKNYLGHTNTEALLHHDFRVFYEGTPTNSRQLHIKHLVFKAVERNAIRIHIRADSALPAMSLLPYSFGEYPIP